MPTTIKEYEGAKGLPKISKSICPECKKIIHAEYYEKNGKVYAKKTCPEHGEYESLIWSDVKTYLRAEEYAMDGIGLINHDDTTAENSDDVSSFIIDGTKIKMRSCTALANIDLTNRCNMSCPICFADANHAGYVYEPSYEEVISMLKMLRDEYPIKCTAVQFSGGEPTVYPRFFDVIKTAKDMGFAQIQVASNGIEFSKSVEFCQKAKNSGLNTIYLSFDGVGDDVYIQARNRKMFHIKLKVLENLRQLDHPPSVVLVPTIVKGMNDGQLGKIINFAFENSDIIRGVNFQPVSFTGRITHEDLEKGRYTLADLVKNFGDQTGYTVDTDWYPVPVVAPISKFASVIVNKDMVAFTAHPHCGLATYLFKDDKEKVTPITRFIDVKRFVNGINVLADKAKKSKVKKIYVYKAMRLMSRCIDKSKMPDGITKKALINTLKNIMSDKSKKTLSTFSWKMMYVGGMHFQDSYNYDITRVERCAVHYATPDLRVIPFCAYNGGPEYRKEIEKKFSVPIDEWKEKNKDEAKILEQALIIPEDERPDV